MALEQTGLEFVAEGADEFQSAIDDASSAMEDFESAGNQTADSFGGIDEIIVGALRHIGEIAVDTALQAGQALVGFAKDSFQGALEAEKGINRLRGAIKRAGDTAPVTEDQALALADSLKGLAGGSDDAVIAAESVLLKFQSIGKETFPQALQVSADLASILGTDMSSAAEQLGRALGNPEAASRLLRQAGVFLTDTEKEQVKSFVDAGDAASAQQFILEKLSTATAGAAEQMAGTVGGQMAIFKETIADAGEQIVGSFLPVLQTLFDQYLKPLIPVIGALADQIAKNILPAFSSFQGRLEDITPAFQPIIDAAQEFAGTFMESFPEIQAMARRLVDFFGSELGITLPNVLNNIASVIRTLTHIWREHGDTILAIIEFTFRFIFGTISGTLTLITGVVDVGLRYISGIFDFWSAILRGDWIGAWTIMRDTVNSILTTIGNTLRTFVDTASNIVSDNLKNAFNQWFFQVTAGLQSAIINAINGLRNIGIMFFSVGFDIMEGIADGIRNASFFVFSAIWDSVWKAIEDVKRLLGIGSPSKVAGEVIGSPIGQGVAQGILSAFSDVQQAMESITMGAMNTVSPASNSSQINNVSNSRSYAPSWNLNVSSSQSSQGIVSDFSILQAMA